MYVCTCGSGTDGELRMYAVLRTEPGPGRAHAEQALSYWARSQPNNEL